MTDAKALLSAEIYRPDIQEKMRVSFKVDAGEPLTPEERALVDGMSWVPEEAALRAIERAVEDEREQSGEYWRFPYD